MQPTRENCSNQGDPCYRGSGARAGPAPLEGIFRRKGLGFSVVKRGRGQLGAGRGAGGRMVHFKLGFFGAKGRERLKSDVSSCGSCTK